MSKERIISILNEQLTFVNQQNLKLIKQVEMLTAQVNSLTASLQNLEDTIKLKDESLEKAANTKKALGKLLSNKSEKITPKKEEVETEKKEPVSLKERGNNNVRRKDHCNIEVVEHDVYPSNPDFDIAIHKWIKSTTSIRYEFEPPHFIKHIYHIHHHSCNGTIVSGKAPVTPLLNSSFDASFFAGILQLRFLYSMSVEKIIKYFEESGIALPKATVHGLVRKASEMLDSLGKTLRMAIREDDYIHMDETYHTVLDKSKKKGSVKGYLWAALAHNLNLVQFFYDKGSRGQQMLTDYIDKDYHGAIQSDGLACYKILEKEEYPHAIRLACFQHCKRKFLDIGNNRDAKQIIDIINRLYDSQHKMPPEISPRDALLYRETEAEPIMEKLKSKLLEIKDKKTTLPKSNLAKAVNYTLNEYPALYNYLLDPRYELDNNAIERMNRYISLSRKNSLFFGSHQGAKRASMIYSLACSCRLNGINSFDYFKDILIKLINVNSNTDRAYLRTLLPDRWSKD